MSEPATYIRTLRHACAMVGGVEPLAAQLGVPADTLRIWLEDKATPPEPVFLAALEIVLRHVDERGKAD